MRPQFAPALRFPALTRFYDALAERCFRDRERKWQLVDLGRPRKGEVVLDLGGGTGTLAALLGQAEPGCRVVVVDVDPAMLVRGVGKVAGGRTALVVATAEALPLPAGRIDRAFSSLVFHHLPPATKRAALGEPHRVLRPGAEFLLLDFGPPQGALAWLLSWPGRLFDGLANTRDNFRGRLPRLIAEAGFTAPEELRTEPTPFGTLAYHRTRRL